MSAVAPYEQWRTTTMTVPYAEEDLATMARLHRENRYDRMTSTVEEITGQPAQSVEGFIAQRKDLFAG